MTPFFYAGFDTIPQQAEGLENIDWKKFRPRSPPSRFWPLRPFYLIRIYSFGSIIDWRVRAQPVPALAVLQRINLFFYIAMLIIATLGPGPHELSFFGASSRLMLAMGRKQMLPADFAEIDLNSACPKAVVVMGTLTLIGPFLGRTCWCPDQRRRLLGFVFAPWRRGMLEAASHRARPAASVQGQRRQVRHRLRHRHPALVIIGLMVVPLLARGPQADRVGHHDRLSPSASRSWPSSAPSAPARK